MAETPPFFAQQMAPPPRKNRTLLIVLVILGALGICCCGIGGYGFFFFKNKLLPAASCIMNIEVVRDATMDYVKDHNGVFPKADSWQDDIKPYMHKELANVSSKSQDPFGFFLSPDADAWACDTTKGLETGLAFNTKLSGKKLADVKDPTTTVLIFEIEKPAHDANRPYKPLDDRNSPKMMGTMRGWASIPIQGPVQLMGHAAQASYKSGSGGVNITYNND